MGVAGTVYSFGQLEQLWINAGGPQAVAPVMAAIALAESSGGASSTNANTDGSTDYGLWQINSSNGANTSYFDPTLNAQAAVRVYKQQGAGAWTTYTSGAYRQFMSNTAPDSSVPSGNGVTPVGFPNPLNIPGDIAGSIGSGISDALVSMLKPLIKIMVWGAETLGGLVLMTVAVVVMMQQSSTVQSVEKTGASLGLDAASVIEPEAAPELQAVKKAEKASAVPRRAKGEHSSVYKAGSSTPVSSTGAKSGSKIAAKRANPSVDEDLGLSKKPRVTHVKKR